MNQGCIKLRISILVLLFPFICFSQSITIDTGGFYRHLISENLLPEQVTFARQMQRLHSSDERFQDSMLLSISLAYAKMGNTDSANSNLVKISATPLFSTQSSYVYLSLLILGEKYDCANKFLTTVGSSQAYCMEAATSIKMLQLEPTIQDTNTSQYSSTIQDIKHKYEHPPHHSAFLAGVYSAVIPGMGKLYLGYKQQALSAFIENVLLGAQATESYLKAGPLSARFIISGALFGLFYGGNIWGSAILAKKQKTDHKKQIDYEIFNYYNTRISSASN